MESSSYVDSVLELVENDFKKITVAEIAKRNNVNKDYINRLFKKQTGYTIKRYIVARKISESKKILDSGKTVKEACFMSGFKDCSGFSRIFKKYEGYPPSQIKNIK